MNPEYARRLLAEHYNSGLSPKEASRILRLYYERKQALPTPRPGATEYSLLEALTVFSLADMHLNHENNPKREDRRAGQRLRKKRTGSRRG